ncbi:hypothetical protein BVX98_01830 [bacterium F11]|nr:hypothetical protein BVX98_01830 [bacterium F11]
MTDLIFLLSSFVAQLVGTLAGFGSATVLTPVATFIMNIKAAIAIVALFHLFGNLSKVWVFRGKVHWPLFWQFGLASLLFTAAGAVLHHYLPLVLLKTIFGGFLVFFVVVSLIHPTFGLKASPKVSILGGASSGFVAGLIGTGGAIRSAFLTAFHLDKETYIATSALIAAVIDLTRIPIYLYGGAFQGFEKLYLIPLLIVVAFVGAKIGKRIVKKLSQTLFRRFVLTFLFVIGCKFLWEGIF